MIQTLLSLAIVIILAADFVLQRREVVKLRRQLLELKRAHAKTRYEMTIECDASDALAKLEQIRVAARAVASELETATRPRTH